MQQPTATAKLSVLSEGEYTVAITEEQPPKISDLLGQLGITNRNGQFYLDGRPVDSSAEVHPGSEAIMLPHIRGG